MCASSSSGDGEPVTAASSSRVPAKGGRNTRGKKRKIGSVPVVGSINTAVRSDSSSGGGETSRDILFPKVSYPEELGYNNGSGLTLVEPPSKRTKVATLVETSTSPKRVTPTQSQSHRVYNYMIVHVIIQGRMEQGKMGTLDAMVQILIYVSESR